MCRALVARLGTHRPILGVSIDHKEDEQPPERTFEEFAARLTQSIRAAQPHGPYYLAGWCVSGMLAYEVAAQLLAAGERVGLVAMLDTVNPEHYCAIPKYRLLASKAAYHLQRLGKQLLRTEIGDFFSYFKKSWHGFVPQLFNRELEDKNPFAVAMYLAAVAYKPKPIGARVLALQPAERPEVRDLSVSWAPHIELGSFEVRDVPGDHFTMFEEPNVGAIAKCIKANLRDNVVEFRRVAAS